MRVFTVSDLHVDYAENRQWVRNLLEEDFSADALIVAGDICDCIELLGQVLSSLVSGFRFVFFVPGNHELWVEKGSIDCSLEKFCAVESLCADLGVHTRPVDIEGLSIVPLYSWYDFSFGQPDAYLRRAWRDFRACRWPDHLQDHDSVAEYFLSLNHPRLQVHNDMVISFSHFLPRIDVMPARIPEKRRKVYPVLGSNRLGQQVESLAPDIHIYGHSHVNQDKTIDGISYVNNAFAYPSEERIARKALHCVYDSGAEAGAVPAGSGVSQGNGQG